VGVPSRCTGYTTYRMSGYSTSALTQTPYDAVYPRRRTLGRHHHYLLVDNDGIATPVPRRQRRTLLSTTVRTSPHASTI
jgi:hypothetical protein